MDSQLTTKTLKITSLENLYVYGITTVHLWSVANSNHGEILVLRLPLRGKLL